MRQVMLASVRTYARRYVAAALAVLVGVAFIVTTNALSSSARNGMLADLAEQYTGAEAVVIGLSGPAEADRALQQAREGGVAASVNAASMQPLTVDGATVTDRARVGSVSAAPALRWQQLVSGTFPTAPGQALADAHAAEANGVGLGDAVTVGRGPDARTVRVTGLVESSSGSLSAPLYLPWESLRAFGDSVLVDNVVTGSGSDGSALEERLSERFTAQPVEDYLEAQQQELTRGVNVISVLLLVFAAIALFVSALVIANTFTILLAQRVRDFALLRCVGATRRQVMRSVRAEALVVGAGSATLGVLVGAGLGQGLATLAGRMFPALPVGAVDLSPLWLGGAWLMGVLVTFGASLLPARRSTRVSPLAALRPELAVDVRTRAGLARVVVAVLTALLGAGLLAASIAAHSLPVMIAGGAVSFVGVMLLGPVLVPACVRVLGLVVGRFGVPGSLAASNSLRNPRRTAATAASLLVGVTLISGLVVGMATVRTTIGQELDQEYPLDATLTSSTGAAPDADVLERVRSLEGVEDAVLVDGFPARVTGSDADLGQLVLLGVQDTTGRSVVHGTADFLAPRRDTLFLGWDTLSAQRLEIGAEVEVRTATATRTMTVAGASGLGGEGIVSAATMRQLAEGAIEPRAVWVRAGQDADAADLRGALSTVARDSGTRLGGGLENRAFVDLQLDVMTGATIALLAVGVLIALVGIANTLGLSVLERTREHALLRAMGLTRRQLRATLAAEAGLLAAVAGVLGVALGTAYAWVAVRAVIGGVVDDVTTVVPAGQLTLVVAVAAAAGLVACLLPARRAARVAPAEGLSAD